MPVDPKDDVRAKIAAAFMKPEVVALVAAIEAGATVLIPVGER